jgi:hypothetical protein
MPAAPEPSLPGPLTNIPSALQWLDLLAVSVALVLPLTAINFPATLLIGPMLSAIAAGCLGATIRIPRPVFGAGQAVVGCVVATSIDIGMFKSFLTDWPIILFAVFSTLVASSFLGWAIRARKRLGCPIAGLRRLVVDDYVLDYEVQGTEVSYSGNAAREAEGALPRI